MGTSLRALWVGSREDEPLRVLHELEGVFELEVHRIDTRESMRSALGTSSFDLVFFDAGASILDLRTTRELLDGRSLDLSIIVVSGEAGTAFVVEAMRSGASDYFCEGNLGARFVEVVSRERSGSSARAADWRSTDRSAEVKPDGSSLDPKAAHEINNHLACIIGSLALASSHVSRRADNSRPAADPNDVQEQLRDAREAASRIHALIESLSGGEDSTRLARQPNPTRSPQSGPKRGRVLIIDDEPLVAKAVGRMLSIEHEVISLGSGVEALMRIAAGARFDVIICDLNMPGMSGMELHSELSIIDPHQADKMVFVSGGAYTPEAKTFLERTSNLCIKKPFDSTHLRAAVSERIP